MENKLTGVNLGGWLVLEQWMTPNIFIGLEVGDEYLFSQKLGQKANSILQTHWKTFITKQDFVWIKNQGLTAVRIPVGYWNFEKDPPFISSPQYLKKAFQWAKEVGLKIIIDLHAAPGSQNGWDHSGKSGEINWHKTKDNIDRTLKVIEKIADQYGSHPNLFGIELLNEPHWDIPLSKLKDFYSKGYELVRNHAPESVSVIFHDSFRPKQWKNFFHKNEFKNVYLDLHLYQCFDDRDIKLSFDQHIYKVEKEWNDLITELQQYVPTIIGEWSLGLDPKTFYRLTAEEVLAAKKNYFAAQKKVFQQAEGEFFWNYKIENYQMTPDWSYKDLVRDGIVN